MTIEEMQQQMVDLWNEHGTLPENIGTKAVSALVQWSPFTISRLVLTLDSNRKYHIPLELSADKLSSDQEQHEQVLDMLKRKFGLIDEFGREVR